MENFLQNNELVSIFPVILDFKATRLQHTCDKHHANVIQTELEETKFMHNDSEEMMWTKFQHLRNQILFLMSVICYYSNEGYVHVNCKFVPRKVAQE